MRGERTGRMRKDLALAEAEEDVRGEQEKTTRIG